MVSEEKRKLTADKKEKNAIERQEMKEMREKVKAGKMSAKDPKVISDKVILPPSNFMF